jgi:AcrR family transcriptional regulator
MELVKERTYRMGARADATVATGERILDAATEVFWERPSDQVSLDEVALRAGVSVRTVIRRFGGRQGLLAAAAAREVRRERIEREMAPVGDVARAVEVLLDHYEVAGERVLKMLAEEQQVPGLAHMVDMGRAVHRQWCTRVFAPAQFVAVCDVYTWKLLRRDAGLSRRQTQLALVELLTPMMGRP